EAEKTKLYNILSLGALKYYIVKVDPKKRMLFNPQESVELHGNTGVYLQYCFARTNSVLVKAEKQIGNFINATEILVPEKAVIKWISKFPAVIREAGERHSPAEIANYLYELVRLYNFFYHEIQILKEPDEAKRNMRLALTMHTGNVIKTGLNILGIEGPERM
ncbi:MAG TPA: DALR anticodon-binding domain-containing protein, partial [Flavobacteriales bacterium]|nr:DALR anticodon-binding domain-containing protein [Flavobacteriales bacterium]